MEKAQIEKYVADVSEMYKHSEVLAEWYSSQISELSHEYAKIKKKSRRYQVLAIAFQIIAIALFAGAYLARFFR